jgi:16S rRNA (uracil1498-N3)-methyltransferase
LNLFYQPDLSLSTTFLDGDESHHASRVLRLTKGDLIIITNGRGFLVEARITSIDRDACNFEIVETLPAKPKDYAIHLAVAPTKNSDRMEWLVEKVTEIGIDSITMVQCARSERKHISNDRLMKMAVSAMKQSQHPWLPQINPLVPFKEFIKTKYDQNFICYVDQGNPDQLKNLASPKKSYGLLIGPEGDFTDEEISLAVSLGWKKVSLGTTRLRTETAALVGCVALSLAN